MCICVLRCVCACMCVLTLVNLVTVVTPAKLVAFATLVTLRYRDASCVVFVVNVGDDIVVVLSKKKEGYNMTGVTVSMVV